MDEGSGMSSSLLKAGVAEMIPYQFLLSLSMTKHQKALAPPMRHIFIQYQCVREGCVTMGWGNC